MKFAFGALAAVVSLAAVTGLASHAVSASEPDTWIDECAMLSRPGERAIQASLLYDCQTNVAAYPEWQAWLRKAQPPTHVLWGRYDPSFIAPGAEAYGRDLPGAEIHLLDAGHFALDEKNDDVANLVLVFLAKHPV